MKNDKKYLNFPVPMLYELHTNRENFFSDVFDVGIYLYSQSLSGSEGKRYKDAKKFFGIAQGKSFFSCIENAETIINSFPANSPTTAIETDMLFDYYKNYKSDFQIECLSAFLAIKSILGKKTYVKTNKALIHARMFGYSSVKDLPKKLTPTQEKYKIRWHMDKVLEKLQIDWYLKSLWNHNRGFYLSFDLSLKELAGIIEDDKYATKKRKLREEKRKALKSVQ